MAEKDANHKKAIGPAILEQARRETPVKVFDPDQVKNLGSATVRLSKNTLQEIIEKSLDDRPLDQDKVEKAKLLLQEAGFSENYSYPVFYGDVPSENIECLIEPSLLAGLDEKEQLALENIDYRTLAAHVAQLEALDPEFADELKAARTARQDFGKAAKPPMPLPTVAPKLWRDHPPGMTATEFVRQVYAPWIEAGVLTRKAIEDCDPALANAYSKRKSAYPDEAIPLARAVHPRTIADPQEAGEHYRAKGRERTARYRNRDKMAHEPN